MSLGENAVSLWVPLVPLFKAITNANVSLKLLVNGGVPRGTEGYRGVPLSTGMPVPLVPHAHRHSARNHSGAGAPSTPANQESATVPLVPLGYRARIGAALRCRPGARGYGTGQGIEAGQAGERIPGGVYPLDSRRRVFENEAIGQIFCTLRKLHPDKFFARRQSLSTIQIF